METNIKIIGKIDISKFEKKAKKLAKPVIDKKIFEREDIHFFIDKSGKIVGKSGCGKIALINDYFDSSNIQNGENWMCNILENSGNKFIVFPLYRTVSAYDNFQSSMKKLEELKEKGFMKPFLKPKNATLYYKSR